MVPTFNCSSQIHRVIRGLELLPENTFFEIWLIDNGSQDGTLEVASRAIRDSTLINIRLFQNSKNINLGGTHKQAFDLATRRGATHVLVIHGDDQASALDIPRLISMSNLHGGKTILGSRFSVKSKRIGYSRARLLGNLVLNLIYSMTTQRWLADLGSGLNLFRVSDLNLSDVMRFGNSLTFNYELILHLVFEKAQFEFCPISWREEDQNSNARNWIVFTQAIKILYKRYCHKSVDKNSNNIRDVALKEIHI